ncbi:prephenate dehydrogenase [Clostridium acetobutylicum]|nr:prephenate dehydrogenase [Clostridium acetobutylicum]
MEDEEFNINLTIVGLGLMGGSYAMALKEKNKGHIWGVDLDNNTLKNAAEMDIIDEGYSIENAYIPLKKSDIVIIAIYPEALVQFVKNNVNNFKKGAIITDVLGIKEDNISYIQSILGDSAEFLGGHPMAGKEVSGFSNASKNIFNNANYILTPTVKNKKDTIEFMKKFIRSIGCTSITEVTPEKHDEIIAFTSQLPHVIAVSLMNTKSTDDIKHFVGGSFRDATRVAMINPDLWCQLFMRNKKNIIDSIEEFQKSLNQIKGFIKEENVNDIKQFLKDAASKKEGTV